MTPSNIAEINFIPGTHCPELDFEWLDEKLEQAAVQFNKDGIQGNILICIDDLVSELKKNEHSQALSRLIFNRRHILPNATISLIITSQKYTACPARIRSAANGVFLFDLNKADLNIIKGELFFMSQKELEIVYKEAFRNQHGFIYILLQPYQIHINFKPFDAAAPAQLETESVAQQVPQSGPQSLRPQICHFQKMQSKEKLLFNQFKL